MKLSVTNVSTIKTQQIFLKSILSVFSFLLVFEIHIIMGTKSEFLYEISLAQNRLLFIFGISFSPVSSTRFYWLTLIPFIQIIGCLVFLTPILTSLGFTVYTHVAKSSLILQFLVCLPYAFVCIRSVILLIVYVKKRQKFLDLWTLGNELISEFHPQWESQTATHRRFFIVLFFLTTIFEFAYDSSDEAYFLNDKPGRTNATFYEELYYPFPLYTNGLSAAVMRLVIQSLPLYLSQHILTFASVYTSVLIVGSRKLRSEIEHTQICFSREVTQDVCDYHNEMKIPAFRNCYRKLSGFRKNHNELYEYCGKLNDAFGGLLLLAYVLDMSLLVGNMTMLLLTHGSVLQNVSEFTALCYSAFSCFAFSLYPIMAYNEVRRADRK